MAVSIRTKVPYFRFDRADNAKRIYMNDLTTADERADWLEFLGNLDRECAKDGLVETRKKIAEAIEEFKRQGGQLSISSAWRYYHSVSGRFKDELGAKFAPIDSSAEDVGIAIKGC